MGKVTDEPLEASGADSMEAAQTNEDSRVSSFSPSRDNFYSNPCAVQSWSDSDDRSSEDGASEGAPCGAEESFLRYPGSAASEAVEEHNYIYYEPTHSYEVNHSYVAPSLEPIPENQVWSTSEETPTPKDGRTSMPTNSEFFTSGENISLNQQSSPLPALLQSFTFESHVGDKCPDKKALAKEDLEEAELNFPLLSQRDTEITKDDSTEHSPAGVTTQGHQDLELGQDASASEPLDSSVPGSTSLGTFLSGSVIPNFHQANIKSAIPNFPALDHSGTFLWKTLSEKNARVLPRNLTHSEVRCSRYSRRHSSKTEGDPIDEDQQGNNGVACQRKRAFKPHPDVDRGYAWVVAVCVLICFGVLLGLLFTCTLYYTEMLKEFGESRSYTAWIGSLVNGFFLLGSIGSSALIQKFSCRVATILGSLVMTAGFIASAFAPSLEVVFVTFGIITASGMNLVFSSAILVLAQYFDKNHSLATTIAMLGNGIGVLILSQVMENVIKEYGWRISFFVCAAISLQLCVVGALFFPLPPSALQQEDFDEELEGDVHDAAGRSSEDESSSSEDEDTKRSPRRLEKKHVHRRHDPHSTLYYRKGLLDKSFSSLVLCPQAGYLSHSLASLEPSFPSAAPRHHLADCEAADYGRHGRRGRSRRRQLHDADLRHNESLASRDSSFLPAFFRRSQLSFSSKLSSAQISLAGVQSSQQSRISLKDSRLDLMFHGLKSNPHSFSLRAPTSSQLEETEQLCAKLDDLLEERSSSEDGSKEKLSEVDSKQGSLQTKCDMGKEFGYTNQLETLKENGDSSGQDVHQQCAEKGVEKKASFLISGGESDEDDDDDASCTSEVKSQAGDHLSCLSKAARQLHALRMACCSVRVSFNPIFKDLSVWCFALSYVCSLLGTATIYVIFADFAQFLGVGSYASTAMSAAGFGDIIGRFGGGMLAVGGVGNSTVLYACSMVASALLLCSYLLVSNGALFVSVTAAYGIMYGAQNMYFAITAKIVFGRESLADVFGLAVFLGGIGSLVGSPLAGLLIDVSGGYIPVLLSEVACCVLGSALMFVCYLRNRNQDLDELRKLDNRLSAESLVSSDGRPLKTGDGGELNCSYTLAHETNKKRRGSDSSRDFYAHRLRCTSLLSAHLMSNSSSRSSVADDEVHVKMPAASNRTGRHHKNIADSRGSLASLPTRAFLHPSHRSHALRSTNSLKRTSTCDSILNRAPILSPMPAKNSSEGGRRFTVSSPRQYNHKKKSPSLYEEVLGRAYAQNHNVCYSDHDLS